MSRRYWLSLIAVVGLISAANAQQATNSQREAPRSAVSQQTPQPQPQPAVPLVLQNSINGIRSALEAANKKGEAPDEKRKAEEDRQAQLSMARSARQMFVVGIVESAITFLGVMLVLGTLRYTRDAAREAKRAADAAEKALKSSDRPHIVISAMPVEPIEPGPEPEKNTRKFAWTFQNYGEDLAFLKTYGFAMICEDVNAPLPEDIVVTISVRLHWPIPPGQGWGTNLATTTSSIPLTEELRDGIIAGTKTLYLIGIVTYRDSANDLHETHFVYSYRLLDKTFIPFDDERHWKYT